MAKQGKRKDREEQKPDAEGGRGEERVRTAAEVAAERAAQLADESARPAQEEAAPPEAPPEPEQPTRPPQEAKGLPPITVPDLLRGFCEVLLAQAWQKMGLVLDPVTGEIVEDLAQARLAIDSAAALVETLEAHLTEAEKRDFNAILANVRINYVQRSGRQEEKEGS